MTASESGPGTPGSAPVASSTAAQPAPTVNRAALQRAIDALVQAQPISFQPDTATLTTPSVATVLAIARLLAPVPAARVEIDGYVAKVEGVYPHTQTLSTQRANRVRVQLASHGVDRSRITVRGMGDSHPIASNATPQGQAANRRVTVHVL